MDNTFFILFKSDVKNSVYTIAFVIKLHLPSNELFLIKINTLIRMNLFLCLHWWCFYENT